MRIAGRVIAVDEFDRVLLLQGIDPGQPGSAQSSYWFTPGGGIDEGETPAMAAAREFAEETGGATTAAALGEPVQIWTSEYGFNGQWFVQENHFFVVRTPWFEPSSAGWSAFERQYVLGARWWTLDEIADHRAEPFYPPDLLHWLTPLVAAGP